MKKLFKRVVSKSWRKRLRHLEIRVRHGFCRAVAWALHFHRSGHADMNDILWEWTDLTANQVILGYAQGIIAAPTHSGVMRWHDPDVRTIINLDEFHIPKRFRSYLNKGEFDVRFDTNFREVLNGCAAPQPGRETTWLNPRMMGICEELHRRGVAHSVEAYIDGELVGGLFGVTLGGLFSVSSMFHTVDNASKVALIFLAELLRRNGFVLIDTEWTQPHFIAFGGVEIPRREYKRRLADAIVIPAVFRDPSEPMVVDYRQYQ